MYVPILLLLLVLPGWALCWLVPVLAINPVIVLAATGAVSSIAYGFYAVDKRRAERGHRRIPEAMLHLLALAGGWPGAFLAQHRVRHKNAKLSFQLVFWTIVALHEAAAFLWLRSQGQLGGNI